MARTQEERLADRAAARAKAGKELTSRQINKLPPPPPPKPPNRATTHQSLVPKQINNFNKKNDAFVDRITAQNLDAGTSKAASGEHKDNLGSHNMALTDRGLLTIEGGKVNFQNSKKLSKLGFKDGDKMFEPGQDFAGSKTTGRGKLSATGNFVPETLADLEDGARKDKLERRLGRIEDNKDDDGSDGRDGKPRRRGGGGEKPEIDLLKSGTLKLDVQGDDDLRREIVEKANKLSRFFGNEGNIKDIINEATKRMQINPSKYGRKGAYEFSDKKQKYVLKEGQKMSNLTIPERYDYDRKQLLKEMSQPLRDAKATQSQMLRDAEKGGNPLGFATGFGTEKDKPFRYRRDNLRNFISSGSPRPDVIKAARELGITRTDTGRTDVSTPRISSNIGSKARTIRGTKRSSTRGRLKDLKENTFKF